MEPELRWGMLFDNYDLRAQARRLDRVTAFLPLKRTYERLLSASKANARLGMTGKFLFCYDLSIFCYELSVQANAPWTAEDFVHNRGRGALS